MKKYLILSMLFISTIVLGQGRSQIKYSINDSWIFFKDAAEQPVALTEIGDREVEIVNLPHSFNAEDAIHGATGKMEGFYQGPAWYVRKVTVPAHYKDKELFVYFEGANQETDVFVNGQFAGNHIGGYTRFVFPVSKFIEFDASGASTEFELAVRVDTTHNLDVPHWRPTLLFTAVSIAMSSWLPQKKSILISRITHPMEFSSVRPRFRLNRQRWMWMCN